MKKRNSSIELLRIISMLLIIIFHFCGRAYNISDAAFAANSGSGLLSKLLFHSMGQTGVPIFMFISGFYGIKFKSNRLVDILIQCFLYTVIFYSICSWVEPSLWSYRVFTLNLFGPSTLWFIYCYLVIYLFSNPINEFLNNLSFPKFTIIIVLFLYFSIGLWIMKSSSLNLFTLLELYVIARYTRLHLYEKLHKYTIWMIIPSIIIFLLPAIIGWHFNCIDKLQPYVNKYYNPFILPICISLIITAHKYSFYNKYINSLASSALACYIIHESSYFPYFVKPFFQFENYSIPRIVIVALGIYIFCYTVDKIRVSIQHKLLPNTK